MNKLTLALKFLAMGISIIPLRHRSKEPMLNTWRQYQTILSIEPEVSRWLGSGWLNYGVVAGWNNLAFLDFDDFETFALWKSYMELVKLPMPYTVLSSRGAHVYISAPGGSNQKRRGVDVKFHGYVVGPGSMHPNGTMYTAINTQYRVMEVDNLDAILPAELFPMVVPTACANSMPAVKISTTNTEYKSDYDPFIAAMGKGTDLISKVKAAVRIETFFKDAERSSTDGQWLSALCPFHDDHNPSLWINVRKQICGCLVCNMKPMDVINLFARQHNISESAAVTDLARAAGVWG